MSVIFFPSSGMSFLLFLMWYPQYFHQVKICSLYSVLVLIHFAYGISINKSRPLWPLVQQAQVSSFCFIIIFHHSFDFCFQFFVIFCFINILSANLSNAPKFSPINPYHVASKPIIFFCLPWWFGSSILWLIRLCY